MNEALVDQMLIQSSSRVRHLAFSARYRAREKSSTSLLDALLDAEHQDIWLRGVYLTSSLQRGQMDDIFTQSAARQYGLQSDSLTAWPLVDSTPIFPYPVFGSPACRAEFCRRKPPVACRIPPSNEYLHRVWRGYRTCARRRLASLVQRKLSCRA
jgi:type VI protein secretion system component VasK